MVRLYHYGRQEDVFLLSSNGRPYELLMEFCKGATGYYTPSHFGVPLYNSVYSNET